MEIEKIKITDIVPAEYNPRNISSEELTKLKNSISTFGLVDPIIINLKNNKIIGGHQRYEVLINEHMLNNDFFAELNLIRLGDVGWIFTETDLKVEDEDHEKALNLALNKISGEWDFEKLGEILDELELNKFDITLTGFDDIEDILIDLDGDYTPNEDNIYDNITEDGDSAKPLGDLIEKYSGENNTGEEGSLKRDYIQPPFSILKGNSGDWLNLKKELKEKINDNTESREKLIDDNFGTSLFDPVLATIIIKWFTPTGQKNILDCFSGDSTIGAIASMLGHKFTGIELRQEQVNLNNTRLQNNESKYICDDGQNVLKHIEENSQDLLFSCPPYYNMEVYSDLPNDASNQETYEDFLEILKNAFTDSAKCLKEDRFAVIVTANIRDKQGFYYPMVHDIIKIFSEAGLYLYNDMILADPIGSGALRARKSFRNRKVVKVHQNILVFYKGNPQHIKENYKLECEEQ